jgi:hypothetical protein
MRDSSCTPAPAARLTHTRMFARTRILTLAAMVALVGCATKNPERSPDARQQEVADRGAMVMPFDLDRTTHVFESTGFGGIQQVVSDDADAAQVALIREHLLGEAERFARGDFHDPATIHGDDMAGMHGLMMAGDRLAITFSEIEGGGQIRYEGSEPEVVDAIHEWFEAQLADHGAHARSGRPRGSH